MLTIELLRSGGRSLKMLFVFGELYHFALLLATGHFQTLGYYPVASAAPRKVLVTISLNFGLLFRVDW